MNQRPGSRGLIAGILLTDFAVACAMIGIATALPTAMRDFDAATLYAWAFSTFVSGMLLATMLGGPLADRFGPRPPILLGFALFGGGLLLGAVAPNVWLLLLARLIQGLGAGAVVLSFYVVLALAFDGAERAKVLGWASFAWLLPAFVGPPIAGWVSDSWSWRWVFAGLLVPIIVAVGLTYRQLIRIQTQFSPPEKLPRMPPALALTGVAAAPALVQLAGAGLGWWSTIAGVVGLTTLLVALPRILPPRVWSLRPGLGPVVLTRGLQAGAFFASEAFILLALQDLRGLSTVAAGLALTIGSSGWTLASWAQARPWMKLRRDQIITLGALICLVGIGLVALFFAVPALPLAVGVLAWVLAGLGMGAMVPSTAVATMSLSRRSEQGRNNSALQVGESLGNALLTAAAGAIYPLALRLEGQQFSFVLVFAAMAAIVGLGVIVSRRIGPLTNESLLTR